MRYTQDEDTEMGSDPARDLWREESCQKKLAPKKRTVPPKYDARKKEDQERATISERRPSCLEGPGGHSDTAWGL